MPDATMSDEAVNEYLATKVMGWNRIGGGNFELPKREVSSNG